MLKTFFSFLLITLIFLSSLGFTVYRLSQPEFVSSQVREANLYGRLTDGLETFLPDDLTTGSAFSREDAVDIIRAGVDSGTFYDFLDQASTAYLDWLTGRSTTLDFRYDLNPVKQKARAKAVDRLVTKYDDLPLCDDRQIRTWSMAESLPACKLPAGSVHSNDISSLAGALADQSFDPLPSQLNGQPTAGLEMARTQTIRALQAVRLIWGLTIILLLLYLLIRRRYGFLSLAFVFLLAGTIEAVFGFIAWDWVGRVVLDLLPDNQSATLPIIVDVVTAILEVLKSTLATLSIVLLVIGGFFLLLAIFYRPKPKGLTMAR